MFFLGAQALVFSHDPEWMAIGFGLVVFLLIRELRKKKRLCVRKRVVMGPHRDVS